MAIPHLVIVKNGLPIVKNGLAIVKNGLIVVKKPGKCGFSQLPPQPPETNFVYG